MLSEHDHLVREVTSEYAGEVIDNRGDGFVVAFPDTGRALLAAIEMQRNLQRVEIAPQVPIAVRMGLHAGDIIRRGTELAGREVHLAARIGAQAGPGEILVSAEVQAELATAVRFRFGEPRMTSFKGFEGHHEVIPVLWEDAADLPTAVAASV